MCPVPIAALNFLVIGSISPACSWTQSVQSIPLGSAAYNSVELLLSPHESTCLWETENLIPAKPRAGRMGSTKSPDGSVGVMAHGAYSCFHPLVPGSHIFPTRDPVPYGDLCHSSYTDSEGWHLILDSNMAL